MDWGPWPAGGTLQTPSSSQGVSLLPLPLGPPDMELGSLGDQLTAAPDLGKGMWGGPPTTQQDKPETRKVFIAKVQKHHSRDVQQ